LSHLFPAAILPRLTDEKATVRRAAVLAAEAFSRQNLQAPILRALTERARDPSLLVRRAVLAALSSVAATTLSREATMLALFS
jgi:HEAT repeat protein